MGIYQRISNWENTISGFVHKSVSIAIGVFTVDGELLDANEIMCVFLKTDVENLKPLHFFVNPTFSQLKNGKHSGTIFEGLLTIGNFADQSFVLQSKIFRKEDKLLVIAEVDVKQLFDENSKMSDLNQEVNNLQRQLIKEKKKLQNTLDELKETQQLLVHSEKMNAMGQLVAGVAHEINNPISFINSNIYSLENYTNDLIESYKKIENIAVQNSSSEIVELIQNIREENDFEFLSDDIKDILKESKIGIDRVKKIVEDLRKFSRLDESDIKHIDLIENINSTIAIVRSEMVKKEVNFEFISTDKLELDCYPGQLNQAILNVFMNAIQAVDIGGNIVLLVSEKEKSVTLQITDDGCGISPEIIEKIFDPFFTTKPVGTGTGLGLSITYKIINDLQKGNIEVKSELGKGTEIFIEIPKTINL